jgi:hypothetical protein
VSISIPPDIWLTRSSAESSRIRRAERGAGRRERAASAGSGKFEFQACLPICFTVVASKKGRGYEGKKKKRRGREDKQRRPYYPIRSDEVNLIIRD